LKKKSSVSNKNAKQQAPNPKQKSNPKKQKDKVAFLLFDLCVLLGIWRLFFGV
jgi:hypothetical protein